MARVQVRAAAVALIAIVGIPVAAAAGPKTDAIVLRNGDRITCEVVRMSQGKLQAKTDEMGTLSVEWDKVTAIRTAGRFDVFTGDGGRYVGRLEPGASGFVGIVDGATGSVSLRMADVVSFAAIKQTFLSRIDGSLDLGASYTQSSGVAQASLDSNARYRQPAYAVGAHFTANATREPDAPNTSRYSLQLTYSRYLRNRWVVSGLGLFESNQDLGFTFRGTGAGSAGRFVVRSRHVEWLLAGGAAAGREKPVDMDTVTNVDALFGSELSVFVHDYPTTRIDAAMLVFPSLDDPGRVRIDATGKIKRELFHDFFIAASLYDAYDSRSKATAARQNDFGGSLSFGWSF